VFDLSTEQAALDIERFDLAQGQRVPIHSLAGFLHADFNVLFHNRDDHPKNLGFRLDAQRHWKLTPCFDLTYSQDPGGEHQMDVCGKGLDIQRSHLMQLAQTGGLNARWAAQRLDGMLGVVDQWRELVSEFDIRQATVRTLQQAVQKQRSGLSIRTF
jgi:serine/threonine-protein kinase HipA